MCVDDWRKIGPKSLKFLLYKNGVKDFIDKTDKNGGVYGESRKSIEDGMMRLRAPDAMKGVLLAFTFSFSVGLFAEGMYEQAELLDRGVEIIEAGVDLYKLDQGYSPEKIQGLKEVSKHTQDIFDQLKNKDILNTERGDYFKKRYQHLMNYLSVSEIFSQCLEGDEEQQVSLKILSALGADHKNVEVSCRDLNIDQNSNFDQFYSNVMAIAGKKKVEDVFQDVSEQSLKNYTRTYANMKYSFDKNTTGDGLVDELCQGKCDPRFKYELLTIANDEFRKLKEQNAPR